MVNQPQAQLEMHWMLDGGHIQLTWTARQPQFFEANMLQPNLDQTERHAA
jgi:hypothetical protein